MAYRYHPHMHILPRRDWTGLMPNPNRVPIFVSRQAECMILPLWRNGYDTLVIANTLCIPESEVYNRLPMLRERHRLENHG